MSQLQVLKWSIISSGLVTNFDEVCIQGKGAKGLQPPFEHIFYYIYIAANIQNPLELEFICKN